MRASSSLPPVKHPILRVMTYNVHGCVGTDRKLDEGRIAEVIAAYSPDVVALQELDRGRRRSQGKDQAHHIAQHLKMDFHFHPAMHMAEEKYGDAVLSRLPMRLIKTAILPTYASRWAFEPRGALLVSLQVDGQRVHLINTHLGLSAGERMAQIESLLSDEWMEPAVSTDRFILCGDFNALPRSRVYQKAVGRLQDVQQCLRHRRARPTFPSSCPLLRVDHIFISADFQVKHVDVPRTPLIRRASDHLPLIADLALMPPTA